MKRLAHPQVASVIVRFQLEDLSILLSRVADCARDAGFASHRIAEIEPAVEEILVNIFSHAYSSEDREVERRCTTERETGTVTVVIADWSEPFDILGVAQPYPASDLESRLVGGLGVRLVKHMTDKVYHCRKADRNEIRLVFRGRAA